MSIDKFIGSIADSFDRVIGLLEEISSKLDTQSAPKESAGRTKKDETPADEKPARRSRSRSEEPKKESRPAVSLDDVRDALTRVYDAEVAFKGSKDLIDPVDILSRFGCKRVSEVLEEQYQDVIDACERAIKTGEV